MKATLKYIDLFAGIGGFRLGFEQAAAKYGIEAKCVLTSEIKSSAIKAYSANFEEIESLDITNHPVSKIPKFDVLLAGFPCQAFSSAGKREGFLDTRGTLFFEIEKILRHHRPSGFILENVEGLVNHDKTEKFKPIGRTLEVILETLNDIGYKTTWKVLDSSDFGLAQQRKRIFIVGSLKSYIPLDNFKQKRVPLSKILQTNLPTEDSFTIKQLLKHYTIDELTGKSLKDKRGGSDNIHSWDINLKGSTNKMQRQLLVALLKARRNKKWGELKGIAWMDGMPLTKKEIQTFFDHPELQKMLDDLVSKKYLAYEHPKDLIYVGKGKDRKLKREYRVDLPKGYNIVAGKLSFEISKVLDPDSFAPTLVATDLDRLMVPQGKGLRKLSTIEMLRLFGFPDNYKLPLKKQEITDLFGNTVPVNIVKSVAERLIDVCFINKKDSLYFRAEDPYKQQLTLF